MLTSHLGELFALLTAVFWTTTSLSFQQATRRAGSLSVNVLRLIIAFFIYGVISYFSRGLFLPFDAGSHQWIWMSVSGLIGFVFGDYFLCHLDGLGITRRRYHGGWWQNEDPVVSKSLLVRRAGYDRHCPTAWRGLVISTSLIAGQRFSLHNDYYANGCEPTPGINARTSTHSSGGG